MALKGTSNNKEKQMYKIILSTTLLMIMNIVINASTLKNSFKNIKLDGYVRGAYETHHVENDKNYNDGAIGGKLHIQTAPFYNITLGASFYSSNAFGNSDNRGLVPFRGEEANGYALLGEVYIQMIIDKTLFKVGRQEIETPFAQVDDIGMVPNTFEAYILENKDLENTTIFLGQIQKMAGVDASVVDSFTRINGTKNMQTLGLHYEGIENIGIDAWYYRLQDAEVDSITYTEARYTTLLYKLDVEIALQYAKQTYSIDKDAFIYGVSTSFSYESTGLSFGFAYNKAVGNAAFSGFGGGPFFSNSEYLIVDNAGKNASQTWIGAALDASVFGAEGLTFSLGYATLRNETKDKATELDFVSSYEVDKHIEIHVIASTLKGSKLGEDNAKHLRIFMNSTF